MLIIIFLNQKFYILIKNNIYIFLYIYIIVFMYKYIYWPHQLYIEIFFYYNKKYNFLYYECIKKE